MKHLIVGLVAVLAVLGVQTSADAVLVNVLIDDFTDPALPIHTSSTGGPPVMSRAESPPAGDGGGSIAALGAGTTIAADRGLWGRPPGTLGVFDPGALVAGSGDLDIALLPGEKAAIDWTVGPTMAFVANPVIILTGLSNLTAAPASLLIALWQDGVMTALTPVIIAPLSTADVSMLALAAPTTLLGIDIVNTSGAPFTGLLGAVVANPEPGTMALIGLGMLGGAFGYRRRRRDDDVVPTSAA